MRTLAEYLFDDPHAMVRLDMSEYMEKHAVARLIGAPPGYVGYEQGGALTEAVRRRPFQVVLFDEIEKAHGDVYNVLLQVLDDGRLTDGQGRTVDFRNTIIVMTSNIGSEHLLGAVERDKSEDARLRVMEEVRKVFRPEFVNRLDEILIFNSLLPAHIRAIVDIQLERVAERLQDKKIKFEVDDDARDWLAEQGYNVHYGARPLQRTIRKELETPLANVLLKGAALEESKIRAALADDKLTFVLDSAPFREVSASERPPSSAAA